MTGFVLIGKDGQNKPERHLNQGRGVERWVAEVSQKENFAFHEVGISA
jgi:hypothetical protein